MNVISLDIAKQDFEAVVARVLADAEPTIVQMATGESIVMVSLEDFRRAADENLPELTFLKTGQGFKLL